MVFEYMKYGDLAALLQSNDPCSGIIPRVKLTQVTRSDHSHQLLAG